MINLVESPCWEILKPRMRRLGAANGGWLVAVSGGPDSFALLDLAHRSVHRTPRTLHAVTVQHHLRAEAENELMSVRRWCEARDIPHHRQDLEPPVNPAAARRARYHALLTVATEQKLPHVLLGHHADDQVESILLALVRGAGPKGLGGMRDRRNLGGGIQVVRPFLETPGQLLRDHALEHQLPFHDEPGNLDPQSARGRIRTLIRPQLELLRQGCGMAMVNNGALMQAAGQALQARAKSWPHEKNEKSGDALQKACDWRPFNFAPQHPQHPTSSLVPSSCGPRGSTSPLCGAGRHDGGDRPGGAGAQTALVADHRAAIQVRLQCFGNANSTVGLLVHF